MLEQQKTDYLLPPIINGVKAFSVIKDQDFALPTKIYVKEVVNRIYQKFTLGEGLNHATQDCFLQNSQSSIPLIDELIAKIVLQSTLNSINTIDYEKVCSRQALLKEKERKKAEQTSVSNKKELRLEQSLDDTVYILGKKEESITDIADYLERNELGAIWECCNEEMAKEVTALLRNTFSESDVIKLDNLSDIANTLPVPSPLQMRDFILAELRSMANIEFSYEQGVVDELVDNVERDDVDEFLQGFVELIDQHYLSRNLFPDWNQLDIGGILQQCPSELRAYIRAGILKLFGEHVLDDPSIRTIKNFRHLTLHLLHGIAEISEVLSLTPQSSKPKDQNLASKQIVINTSSNKQDGSPHHLISSLLPIMLSHSKALRVPDVLVCAPDTVLRRKSIASRTGGKVIVLKEELHNMVTQPYMAKHHFNGDVDTIVVYTSTVDQDYWGILFYIWRQLASENYPDLESLPNIVFI